MGLEYECIQTNIICEGMEKKYLLILTLLVLTACQEENFLRLELSGNISTPHYFVMVQLGTPPQMQELQIDTGSNYLAVHCSTCKTETCRQSQLPLYNPVLSKTSATIPCSKDNFDCMNKCSSGGQVKPCLVSSYYGTYSSMYKGDLYQDEFDFFTIAQQEGRSFTVPFICSQFSNAGSSIKFYKHTQNGILGLGPDPLLNPLFHWFQLKQPNAAKVFSVCLAAQGGYLQVGADPTLPEPELKGDLSFQAGNPYYIVQGIRSMHIGETLLMSEQTLKKNRIVIDSGAKQQYIQSEAYVKFTNILLNICSMNTVTCDSSTWKKSRCFVIETSNIKGTFLDYLDSLFPSLIVNLGSINITTPPSEYMHVQQGDVAGSVCSSILPSPIDNTIILGRNWQRNQKITFDLDNNKITIVPNSDCTFQRQSLNYRTNTSFKTIAISYSILLGLMVFILGGSSLCFWCSRFKNRLVKKPIQFVEESQQNSAPASIE